MTTIVSGKVIGIQISEELARKHAKRAKVKNSKWQNITYVYCVKFQLNRYVLV